MQDFPTVVEDNTLIDIVLSTIEKNELSNTPTTVWVWCLEFISLPTVFQASIWYPKSSDWYPSIPVVVGGTFLEIGTGTGIYACKAALDGASLVVATDINPFAIENVILNANKHKINTQSTLIAFQSDIFDNPRLLQYKFDVIFWNIPNAYLSSKEHIKHRYNDISINRNVDNENVNVNVNVMRTLDINNLTLLEKACFDPDFELINRYLAQGAMYLTQNGKLYVGWSQDLTSIEYLKYIAKFYGWDINLYQQIPSSSGIRLQLWELVPKDRYESDKKKIVRTQSSDECLKET